MRQCKACHAEIIFVPTSKGNIMPLDAEPEKRCVLTRTAKGSIVEMVDTYIPHFVTCPQAAKFRKKTDP
jgi:hypothetical protein